MMASLLGSHATIEVCCEFHLKAAEMSGTLPQDGIRLNIPMLT